MHQKILKPFWQALALGVLAGMRANSAPAVVSHILSQQPSGQLENSPLKLLQSSKVANALKVLTLGEFVGDKLPVAGDRIKPVSVTFRSLSGLLAGTSICKANGNHALTGAVLGAAAAFGSTFGSFYLRKMIVKKTGIYDPVIGAIEDILVIGAAISLIKYSEQESSEFELAKK